MDTPTKTTKTATSQEQTSTSTPVAYTEWAAPIQALYNSGKTPVPPGYFHSAVASSPQAHPYMWGLQHMMPPYGTPPPPYVAMYSHGAMYTHPSMPAGAHLYGSYGMSSSGVSNEVMAGAVTASVEGETKSSQAKDRSPLKSTKGSLGSLSMLTGKTNETGKETTANGVFSQSGESGSEGSSEGSDGNSPNGSQSGQKTHFEQGSMEADEAQNGNATSRNGQIANTDRASGGQVTTINSSPAMAAVPMSLPGTSGTATGPMTNLNIGMDYWCVTAPTPLSTMRAQLPLSPTTSTIIPSAQNMPAMGTELSLQDERELKRQRRKQSNRESARRSRMRKQAECEELARRVEELKSENSALRTELTRLQEECEKLTAKNNSLTEELKNVHDNESRETRVKDELENADTEQ